MNFDNKSIWDFFECFVLFSFIFLIFFSRAMDTWYCDSRKSCSCSFFFTSRSLEVSRREDHFSFLLRTSVKTVTHSYIHKKWLKYNEYLFICIRENACVFWCTCVMWKSVKIMRDFLHIPRRFSRTTIYTKALNSI